MVTPTERFAELMGRPEDEVDLDEVALLIAAHGQPDLVVAEQLARLDALARAVPEPTVEGVVSLLFHTVGLQGEETDYDNPRNSYLNVALDRRRGLPITLSVILIEVARRVGVELVGVGMPGHFLVGTRSEPVRYLDAFDRGRILDEAGCAARFAALSGGQALPPGALAPVGPHAIALRMVTNLRAAALKRGDRRLLVWTMRLRCLIPGATARDRLELAGALAGSGRFAEAADELESQAESSPGEADELRRQADRLRARLN